jgi:hypothetical protein
MALLLIWYGSFRPRRPVFCDARSEINVTIEICRLLTDSLDEDRCTADCDLAKR